MEEGSSREDCVNRKSKEAQEKLLASTGAADDSQYLKNYVRTHPDNKMAWYLLGREYAAKGEAGKAQYCFRQAGEVYEAFEENRLDADGAADAPTDRPPEIGGGGRRKNPAGLIVRGVLGMLLFLAALIAVPLDGHAPDSVAEKTAAAPVATAPTPGTAADSGANRPPSFPEPLPAEYRETAVWYASGLGGREALEGMLRDILLPDRLRAGHALLLQGRLTADGGWIAWGLGPQTILTADRMPGAAQAQVRYHDAEACACTPEEDGAAKQMASAWQAAQEQDLILRSAVRAYARKHGTPPPDPGSLSPDYPNNWLPGTTPFMAARLSAMAGSAAAPPQSRVPPQPAENPAAEEAAAFQPIPELAEPLRIIVDMASHRLALVSGRAVLRNYPIGIGAPKTPTPEGEFVISEKVKNPNGRSDGDFGSRGMTLSDTLYAIHGTNRPSSIERDESLGCIRMLNADIEELFDMIPIDTPVTVGSGLLPSEIIRAEVPFRMPSDSNETNPKKRYKWLG